MQFSENKLCKKVKEWIYMGETPTSHFFMLEPLYPNWKYLKRFFFLDTGESLRNRPLLSLTTIHPKSQDLRPSHTSSMVPHRLEFSINYLKRMALVVQKSYFDIVVNPCRKPATKHKRLGWGTEAAEPILEINPILGGFFTRTGCFNKRPCFPEVRLNSCI